jgi:hypothetical protein
MSYDAFIGNFLQRFGSFWGFFLKIEDPRGGFADLFYEMCTCAQEK